MSLQSLLKASISTFNAGLSTYQVDSLTNNFISQNAVTLQGGVVVYYPQATGIIEGALPGYTVYISPMSSAHLSVMAKNRSAQVIPNSSLNATLTNWTEIADSLNAFDPVTGLFVAPADGFYQVDVGIVATSSTAAYGMAVLVNDVAKLQIISALAGGQSILGGLVQLAKNDVLRVGVTNFSGVSVTLFNNAGAPGANYLSISQQG